MDVTQTDANVGDILLHNPSRQAESGEIPQGVILSEIIFCDPCLYDESKKEASGFCWTCFDYLCPSCIKEHKKARMSRKHIIQQDDFPKNAESLKEVKVMITCSLHTDMTITYYCESHLSYACSICRAENHTKCEKVVEIVKAENTVNILNDVQEEFLALSEAIDSTRKTKTENMNGLHEDVERFSREKQSLTEEVLDMSENDTKVLTKNFVQKIEKDITEFEEMINSHSKYQQIFDAALADECNENVNVIAYVMDKRIKTLLEDVDALPKKGPVKLQRANAPLFMEFQCRHDIALIGNKEYTTFSESDQNKKHSVENREN